MGATSVTISLERDVLRIDQVVITGQATTIERRSAPNAIATVDASELSAVPTISVEHSSLAKSPAQTFSRTAARREAVCRYVCAASRL